MIEYFESGVQDFVRPGSSEATHYIEGPSVASIGWIPRLSSLLQYLRRPRNAYNAHASFKMRTLGFPALFWTGNPAPGELADEKEFCSFLAKKEFRGALALDRVKLYCNIYDEPVKISFSTAGEVGFTPIRGPGFGIYSPGVLGQSSGQWKPFTVLDYRAGVSTQGSMVFKVGKLGDWANKISTGRWLPYVRLDIEYTLRTDGFCIVRFDGSFIPSQDYYGNWRRERHHDMLENEPSAVDGFFESGLKEGFWAEKHVMVSPQRSVKETWSGRAK